MTRILFWIGLLVLVVLAIRSKLRAIARQNDAGAAPGGQADGVPARTAAVPDAEAMACCAHCHVYFPASEAVRADGLEYCSPAHVRLPAK